MGQGVRWMEGEPSSVECLVADLDFSSVSVLLFDPVGANMSSTRAVMKGLGFTRIEAVREYPDFVQLMKEGSYDLIVAEVADVDGDVEGLIRRLRSSEIGLNPFAVVILTSWARTPSEVRAAIDCGSDDVLLRPFSPAGLLTRIESFVTRRKSFVVTGDYIGPDRRKDPTHRSDIQMLTPPNALRAAATGDYEALRRQDTEIQAAIATVANQRISRLVMRIAAGAHLRLSGQKINVQAANADMEGSVQELRRRLRARRVTAAIETSTGLCEVVARIIEDGDADSEQLRLVAKLAVDAYRGLEGDNAAASLSLEIEMIVEKLTQKQTRTVALADS